MKSAIDDRADTQHEKAATSYSKVVAVDLFCGVGGLTKGLEQGGLTVVAGVDFDETCKFAFEANTQATFMHKDITSLQADELQTLFPSNCIKVLVGCAPCQPFSKVPGEREDKTDKWRLLYSFSDLIKEVQPEVVSMENVTLLASYKGGEVLNDFIDSLAEEGYHVQYYRVNAMHYGVPQRRNRLILFASKHGKVQLIPPTHRKGNYVSVRKAIGDLPPISDGETSKSDALHRARKLTPINKRRIAATPPGGDWSSWPAELLEGLTCRKSEAGKEFRSAYGRMHWEEPAPTLTTQCIGLSNGRYGHPEQNRAISLREAALLQSFPLDYDFLPKNGNVSVEALARHIGNAVPPLLGKAIAESITKHLSQVYQNGQQIKMEI